MVTPEMLYQARLETQSLNYSLWVTQELFSGRWWGQLIFILLSYALCFTLLDKRRATQILLFGSLVSVMITVFDTFGSSLHLWSFFGRFFPFVPSIFLFDLTVAPLYLMLVYQYGSSWKAFFLWLIVAASIISFIFLPLLTFLKIYRMYNWNYFYTFIVLLAVGVVGRVTMMMVINMEVRRKNSV